MNRRTHIVMQKYRTITHKQLCELAVHVHIEDIEELARLTSPIVGGWAKRPWTRMWRADDDQRRVLNHLQCEFARVACRAKLCIWIPWMYIWTDDARRCYILPRLWVNLDWNRVMIFIRFACAMLHKDAKRRTQHNVWPHLVNINLCQVFNGFIYILCQLNAASQRYHLI